MATFRKARIGDADEIAHVLLQNYKIKDAEEAISTFKKEFIKGHNFIVAIENGDIVGVASWMRHGLPKHQLAWLNRFAFLKDVPFETAEELFSTLVQDADKTFKEQDAKLRKIFVFCHMSNEKMKKFYEKLGLVKEAVLKDHFYKGEDELIYSMFFE